MLRHLRLLVLVVPLAAGCIFPDPDKLRTTTVVADGSTDGGTGGAGALPNADAMIPGSGDGLVADVGGPGGDAAAGQGGAGATPGGAGGVGVPPADTGPPPVVDAMADVPVIPTPAEVCPAYADASVAVMARCGPLVLQLIYGTQAVATQRFRLLCRYLDLPGVNFPKRPIGPCLEALRTFPCDDWLDGRTPLACQAPGDYPAGTPCTGGDQCQTSVCDLSAPVAGCGQCSAPLPGPGVACFQGQFCAAGLLCTAGGTCARAAELGAACNTIQPCRSVFQCKGGVCARRAAVGAPCASRDDCDESSGAFCNPNTGVCIAVKVGTPCGIQLDGTANICPASGTCQNPPGSCLPAANDGAACDETNGPNCIRPASCVAGTCQLPGLNPACRRAATRIVENPTQSRVGFVGSVGDLFGGPARFGGSP